MPLGCSTAPGLGLAALCVAGKCCIENIELSCAMFQTFAGKSTVVDIFVQKQAMDAKLPCTTTPIGR